MSLFFLSASLLSVYLFFLDVIHVSICLIELFVFLSNWTLCLFVWLNTLSVCMIDFLSVCLIEFFTVSLFLYLSIPSLLRTNLNCQITARPESWYDLLTVNALYCMYQQLRLTDGNFLSFYPFGQKRMTITLECKMQIICANSRYDEIITSSVQLIFDVLWK